MDQRNTPHKIEYRPNLCATYGQKIDAIHGQRVFEEWCGQKKGCFVSVA